MYHKLNFFILIQRSLQVGWQLLASIKNINKLGSMHIGCKLLGPSKKIIYHERLTRRALYPACIASPLGSPCL